MVMSNTRGLPTVRFQSLANFLLTTFRKTGIKKEAVNGPILENFLEGKWKLVFFLKKNTPTLIDFTALINAHPPPSTPATSIQVPTMQPYNRNRK